MEEEFRRRPLEFDESSMKSLRQLHDQLKLSDYDGESDFRAKLSDSSGCNESELEDVPCKNPKQTPSDELTRMMALMALNKFKKGKRYHPAEIEMRITRNRALKDKQFHESKSQALLKKSLRPFGGVLGTLPI